MSDDLAPPAFPPLIAGHPVAASGDAFQAALDAVKAGTASAGDLFWSEAVNRLDFALVLEPEVEALRAVQAHLVVMVAFGDALGAIAPPVTAVHYRWPGTLLINGAAAGEVRTALSATGEGESAAYMVTGVTLAIQPAATRDEPGLRPDTTSLWDEGCGDIDRTLLIESITRHILTWIDTWENEGFRPVHEMWCGRIEEADGETAPADRSMGLDEDGNLLVASGAGTAARRLIEQIERF